jgi:hypothetical protein
MAVPLGNDPHGPELVCDFGFTCELVGLGKLFARIVRSALQGLALDPAHSGGPSQVRSQLLCEAHDTLLAWGIASGLGRS